MLVTSAFFSFHSIVKATFHPESVSVLMSILITGCPVAGPAETSGKKNFFLSFIIDRSVRDCECDGAREMCIIVSTHVANNQKIGLNSSGPSYACLRIPISFCV